MFHSTFTSTGETDPFYTSVFYTNFTIYIWPQYIHFPCMVLVSCFSAAAWSLRMCRYWQMQFLTSSLTWSGPGKCHATWALQLDKFGFKMWFLWMCLDSGCVSLCQGGPSRSNLQAGGHLQSKLYGLSWQDQCGPSCYCPGSDGTTGVIFLFPLFWIFFFVYDNLYIKDCILCVLFFLQLKKLGVMPPEQPLPLKCYRIYQVMWANNGDTISRQYAGTAALKVS